MLCLFLFLAETFAAEVSLVLGRLEGILLRNIFAHSCLLLATFLVFSVITSIAWNVADGRSLDDLLLESSAEEDGTYCGAGTRLALGMNTGALGFSGGNALEFEWPRKEDPPTLSLEYCTVTDPFRGALWLPPTLLEPAASPNLGGDA